MASVRLYVVGGFLGAGKTTTLMALARCLMARGERVAVVTNDQSVELVDTRAIKAQGIPVEEVAGACFCCSFNELVDRLESLQREVLPSVILAEPVGSCTDLSATVLQPLKKFYGDRISVGPLTVLVDPQRAHPILTRQPRGGYSPRAAYIYRKQLEEADVLVVNKIDMLEQSRVRDEVIAILRGLFPDTPLFTISARYATNLESLLDTLEKAPSGGFKILELDYDIYAEGEAELGWLNAAALLRLPQPRQLEEIGCQAGELFKEHLRVHTDAEIAHLKLLLLGSGQALVCNATSMTEPTRRSSGQSVEASEAELILNCRAFVPPEVLEQAWYSLLERLRENGSVVAERSIRAMRPARPVPTYRFAEPTIGKSERG